MVVEAEEEEEEEEMIEDLMIEAVTAHTDGMTGAVEVTIEEMIGEMTEETIDVTTGEMIGEMIEETTEEMVSQP